MRSVWIAGGHHDCLLSACDAELLVGELRRLPADRYPRAAAAAASLIEGALEGDREAPAISIDASQHPAVLRALEELLGGRRVFSEGLGDLLDILSAETPAGTESPRLSSRQPASPGGRAGARTGPV